LFGLGWLALVAGRCPAGEAPRGDLWARENLVPWCNVAYDAKKRDSVARAAMLEQVGLRRLAYDWRAEQVASLDEEGVVMKQHRIELFAWWFPTKFEGNARKIPDMIGRHQIHPQLWVTGGGEPTKSDAEEPARVVSEVKRIRLMADEAARLGCQAGRSNHGGWLGEPENQMEVLAGLRAEGVKNVGLVYNFHHGHDPVSRFAWMWPRIQAAVLAVSLNGMAAVPGRGEGKILPLSEGVHDLAMMRITGARGWRGYMRILNHRTEVDAEVGLRRNLAGSEKLAVSILTK
jgi:hypothetical protein